jgi:hypothetical protein
MDYGAAYLFCEWVIQKLGMHESRKRKIGVDRSMGLGSAKRTRFTADASD